VDKRKRTAGYLVNLLMFAYLAIGVGVTLAHSVLAGILYVVLIPIAFLVVAYAWCARCPCRLNACTHIWVGKLTRFLPQRKPGEPSIEDWVGQAVYIAALHLPPQYWLWQHKPLFALFWGLMLATFLVGPLYACKGCPNKHCYVGALRG